MSQHEESIRHLKEIREKNTRMIGEHEVKCGTGYLIKIEQLKQNNVYLDEAIDVLSNKDNDTSTPIQASAKEEPSAKKTKEPRQHNRKIFSEEERIKILRTKYADVPDELLKHLIIDQCWLVDEIIVKLVDETVGSVDCNDILVKIYRDAGIVYTREHIYAVVSRLLSTGRIVHFGKKNGRYTSAKDKTAKMIKAVDNPISKAS